MYHKKEIIKDPRVTNEDFGGFLNDKLEQLLDKEEYAKNNFPNCSVLSISDNVIYIKDRVLKGVVEIYYMFLFVLICSANMISHLAVSISSTRTGCCEVGSRRLQRSPRQYGTTIYEGNQRKISKKNQFATAKTC